MRLIDADALIEFCAERWIPLNIDAVNMQPTIQPEKAQLSQQGTTSDQPVATDTNVGATISKFIDGLEETFAYIREREGGDSVCGLCEYDGAYIGESGDWCNECPGFNRDDCFKLSDETRKKWTDEIIKALPTIQPEKAQLSSEDATSDTISRRETIDRFNVIRPVDPKKDEYTKGIDVGIAMCIVAVKDQPTAQPEPHWIPVSERMPEEHEWLGTKKFGTTISDEVYVTFENEKGERFCQHMKFQNGELSRYDQFHMDTWFKGSKPIAWMPLPEAYKPNK